MSSRLPRPTPRPASCALLSTRQAASKFNQPLSFDTSSVTDMQQMFQVRSAHTLAPPSLHSRALFPCMPLVRCRRPTPSRPRPTPRPASYIPPLDSAVCGGVQPAAELRHVQSHDHAQDVFRAPPTRAPCPRSSAAGPSLPARCLRRRTHALPPPRPRMPPPPLSMPSLSTWQKNKVFNQQLSFDTSSVTTMSKMFMVRRRAHALPASPALHAAPSSHAPASHSAERDGIQPAAGLRHVQRHGHGLHDFRAPPARAPCQPPGSACRRPLLPCSRFPLGRAQRSTSR